jgi:hypothetical protein
MRNDEVILWGMKKAAAELNLTSEHLRRLCDAGAVPHMRDSSGKRLLFPDVVAAFRRRREAKKAEANGSGKQKRLKLRLRGE